MSFRCTRNKTKGCIATARKGRHTCGLEPGGPDARMCAIRTALKRVERHEDPVDGIWDDMINDGNRGYQNEPSRPTKERRPRLPAQKPKKPTKEGKPKVRGPRAQTPKEHKMEATQQLPIPGCILFPGRETTTAQLDVATDTLLKAQPKSSGRLYDQWLPMFSPMRQFLSSIGCDFRTMQPSGLRIPGAPVVKDGHYRCGEHFRMTGAEIQATMVMTRRTHLRDQVTQQQADNRDLDYKPQNWADGEYRRGQMMAVSGPVHVVADDTQRSIPKSNPVFSVSIPGINFAYSTEDVKTFISGARPNKAAFHRVCQIWHHVLSLFREANVRCPVLCAIGCGAFAGGYSSVPKLYASTGGVRARPHTPRRREPWPRCSATTPTTWTRCLSRWSTWNTSMPSASSYGNTRQRCVPVWR